MDRFAIRSFDARRAWRVVLALCTGALVAVALLLPSIADAQRRGGGGRGGGAMARSSVSGANRASQRSSMRSAQQRPARQPSQRPAQRSARQPTQRPAGAQRPQRPTAEQRPARGDNTINIDNSTDVIVGGNPGYGGNVDIDVDHDGWGNWHDVDVDIDGGPGDWEIDVDVDHYHPVATAAAIATTAAIASSYYYRLPVGCPIVYTYPVPYYHCGGVYYEQRMEGDTIVYVVVQP